MGEIVHSAGERVRSIGQMSGVGIAFVYLVWLSVGSVVLVVALLTAYQFQHGIRTAELNGKSVALWKVVELRENWKTLKESSASLARELETAQQDLTNNERNLREILDKYRNAESNSRILENALISKLVELGIPYANIKEATADSFFLHNGPLYREFSKGIKDASGQGRATLDEQLHKYEASLSVAMEIDAQRWPLDERIKINRELIEKLKTVSGKASEPFVALLGKADSDPNNTQLLGNFLSQLNALDSSWFGLLGTFATMEPDFLTLLLVLAMGTLGGTLHLARVYLEGTANSVGYFLYRPFLGAIAALVVFVVARTGVFVVAEPGNQNSGAPLSPFFISFVAIVSGLLAEEAIASIQGTGAKWFTGSVQDLTDRYSLRVAEETAKQKKDKTQLQKSGELEEEELQSLFDGKKKVSAQTQRIAAVWLGKPIRELFTDLPPPEQKK